MYDRSAIFHDPSVEARIAENCASIVACKPQLASSTNHNYKKVIRLTHNNKTKTDTQSDI